MKRSDPKPRIVRYLGKLERFFLDVYKCARIGTTVYSLHVRSEMELQDCEVIDSLCLLQRKLQHLRLCISKRFLRHCLREMDHSRIDYKRLPAEDWRSVHEDLLRFEFDLASGPLWCCRLLYLRAEDPDARIGVRSALPFAYVVLFSILHVITDGTSNMKMCNDFVRILNDRVAGRKLRHERSLPVLGSVDELLPRRSGVLRPGDAGPLVRNAWRFLFQPRNAYVRTFGSPPPRSRSRAECRFVPSGLDEEETSRLIGRCKEKGCTVHGAITTACALAMHKLVCEAGGGEQQQLRGGRRAYHVGHAVNLRRHIARDVSDAYGLYIALVSHTFHFGDDLEERFWDYAEEYTRKLRRDFQREGILHRRRILETLMTFVRFYLFWRKHASSRWRYEFSTTNMGKVDHLLKDAGGSENHVEVVAIYRSTAFQKMGVAFDHNVQTYRGRLFYNLDYFTSHVTEENAVAYADMVIRMLKKAAE